jgi:hypothetical protein
VRPAGHLTIICALVAFFGATSTGSGQDHVIVSEESACAPTLTYTEPTSPLRVVGTTDVVTRLVYGPGQTIVVGHVENQGVEAGQLYFVRRIPRRFGGQRPDAEHPAGVHTAGWIQILTVSGTSATANVIRACDGLLPGDYLEPFMGPQVPRREGGSLQLDDLATILSGDEERAQAARQDAMIVDRGVDHGVSAGDTFVVFRKKRAEETPLAEVGEGIVLLVQPSTSTVQITRSRDAVLSGDRVAFRR